MSFVKTTDGVLNKSPNELDQSYMYTQILKEILLTIDFDQSHINDFFIYCRRKLFVNKTSQLKIIDKIEKEYRHHQPIWWYTYDYFFYSMLNKALRTMDIDLIIKMGFFIRDLHENINALQKKHYRQQKYADTFTVYRGQGLSHTDFDQLQKTQGGLMSFNNFLSTSIHRTVSFQFAESNQDNDELIGVLFKITIDSLTSSMIFADIHDISAYPMEQEILFSMHSVFRIDQMKQIDGNERLWQVDLTLTNDNDPQLQALTERMRVERLRDPQDGSN